MSDQSDEYLSPDEMAQLHGVAPNTILRILRADQELPDEQRRIPGAQKRGGKHRGIWLIPRAAAERWQRDPRGRK